MRKYSRRYGRKFSTYKRSGSIKRSSSKGRSKSSPRKYKRIFKKGVGIRKRRQPTKRRRTKRRGFKKTSKKTFKKTKKRVVRGRTTRRSSKRVGWTSILKRRIVGANAPLARAVQKISKSTQTNWDESNAPSTAVSRSNPMTNQLTSYTTPMDIEKYNKRKFNIGLHTAPKKKSKKASKDTKMRNMVRTLLWGDKKTSPSLPAPTGSDALITTTGQICPVDDGTEQKGEAAIGTVKITNSKPVTTDSGDNLDQGTPYVDYDKYGQDGVQYSKPKKPEKEPTDTGLQLWV